MPSLLTHYLFAGDVFDTENESSFLVNNRDVFSLAAQGPDVLFFAGIFPPQLDLKIAKYRLGSRLHKENIFEFFEAMLTLMDDYQDQSKEVIASFILGFMCHYVLDRTCHPYVYYHSGVESKNNSLSGKSKYHHSRLEALIDYKVRENHNFDYKTLKPKEVLIVDSKKLELVSSFFANATKKIFKDAPIKENTYLISVRNYRKVVNSLSHLPRNGLYHLHLRNNIVFSLMIPKSLSKEEKVIDFMNEKHHTWYHPETIEKSKKSFMNLYNQALVEIKDFIRCVINAYERKPFKRDLKKLVNIKDYNGNRIGTYGKKAKSILR